MNTPGRAITLTALAGALTLAGLTTLAPDARADATPPATLRLGTGVATSLALTADGTQLAVGSSIGVWFLNAVTLDAVSFWSTADWVRDLAYDETGRFLRIEYTDFPSSWWVRGRERFPTLKLIGASTLDLTTLSPIASETVTSAWHDDHCAELFCSRGAWIFRNATGQAVRPLPYVTHDTAWSPDGSRLYLLVNGSLQVWNAPDFTLAQTSALFTGEIRGTVLWSPDGARIAVGRTVWDTYTGQVVAERICGSTWWYIDSFTFDCEPTLLASGPVFVSVPDPAGGPWRTFYPHHRSLDTAELSPDRALLVTSGRGIVLDCFTYVSAGQACPTTIESTRIWDPVTLTLRGELPTRLYDAQFSVDGTLVIGHTLAGDLEVWRWKTAERLLSVDDRMTGPCRWQPCARQVTAVSPDGQRIATFSGASDTDTVRVYALNDGARVATLNGHTAPVISATFSPDGTRLAALSLDGSILVWDLGRP